MLMPKAKKPNDHHTTPFCVIKTYDLFVVIDSSGVSNDREANGLIIQLESTCLWSANTYIRCYAWCKFLYYYMYMYVNIISCYVQF